jgi:hypothetical protein
MAVQNLGLGDLLPHSPQIKNTVDRIKRLRDLRFDIAAARASRPARISSAL